jgi:integrase/recombinase XerD
MTHQELLSKKCSLSSVIDNSPSDDPNEGYHNHINLETFIEAISQPESFLPPFDEDEPNEILPVKRASGLDPILKKLSLMDIFGKEEMEEYLRDQHRRNCRASTLKNSLITIGFFLMFIKGRGKKHLEEVSRDDFEVFIEHEQDRGMKASTVNMRLRTLKAFIRFLMDKEIVGAEVLSKRLSVKVPDTLPRAMDPDDVKKLLSVIEDIRDRAMVLVLLRTGMRIGELLNTLVVEVNLKEQKIEIYEAEKTRVGRVVYLSDDAIRALKGWFRKRNGNYPYIFYGRKGWPLSYPAARMRFEKCVERAGLKGKGYTLHCLRHTFATELLNAGMRLECLQPLLGHSCLEMTRRYARLTDKTREEEYFRAMAIIEKGGKGDEYD